MRVLLLGALTVGCAVAQLADVPPVIQITRKPGIESLSYRPYEQVKAQVEVIGLTSVTGVPETWMIEAHPNFMSIENLDKAIVPTSTHDDLVAPRRTMIGAYRADWSYRPQEAIRRFPYARYFHISIYRIRPGEDDALDEMMENRKRTFESINLSRPDLVYHIISGDSAGIYMVVAPLVSLKIMDDGMAALPAYAEPIAAAEAAAGKKVATIELSREHLLFRVDPAISWVSDEFASSNRDFWREKK